MSKVICDVCGTTYPETAATCPICGCAKNSAEQTAAESFDTGSASYNYVKGGRFSKSNVRKRNRGKVAPQTGPQDGSNPNKGLVVVVLLLLLAIVAVLCYIGFKFLFPVEETDNPSSSSSTVQQGQQGGGNVDDPERIPCTGLILPIHEITLQNKDTIFHLSVEKQPANSTDTVTFTSSNESVATVDEKGKIYPVAPGEAVITVTCGEVTEQCTVRCTFAETPGPTEGEGEGEGEGEENPTPEVPEGFVLKFRNNNWVTNGFQISEKYPQPVSVYKEIDGVKATDITWTSDDENVATISKEGVVTAVGKGTTKIHGTIAGQTITCTVYVAFDPVVKEEQPYTISHSDVTLNIGKDDSFQLSLKDEHGANVQDVVWTANEEGYVEIDGRNIKGIKDTGDLKNKYVLISATVGEHTYSCKVYVHQPEETE